MIRDKGYGTGNGSHLVNFANPQESTLVQQGRAGKESPTAGLFRSGTTFRIRILSRTCRISRSSGLPAVSALWPAPAALQSARATRQ